MATKNMNGHAITGLFKGTNGSVGKPKSVQYLFGGVQNKLTKKGK